ncbi:hypothetical protein KSF_109140 [Reticulibacter mediterranei]|uniref:DNA (cytosine-5-)-methyltransferase n=1 Tax=Reticulibacter mediterranei TaxID=2778369 RepID=A0A8J3J535_9CHLR|nr:DNA cytosine methyltransferase [Reticulibacter mediterranei]GHP00867.1 hypothetical protein KSF_109140 [Reticulibacter mediterranei]
MAQLLAPTSPVKTSSFTGDLPPIITAIEFYAGGGGFSEAFRKILAQMGWRGKLLLAVNHNAEAIKTHKGNFPETEHRQAKVEHLIMEELYDAQVLFGSPECKWQTVARGKKLKNQRRRKQFGLWSDWHEVSEAEKSRASMWQMYEATKAKMKQQRPFQIVLIENVVEAATKWADHDDWVEDFKALGYRYQGIFINAKFCSVPSNRDRYFAVFTHETLPEPDLDLRPRAICHACGQVVEAVQCWKPKASGRRGKYASQYDYRCPQITCGRKVTPFFRPAASFINFEDQGKRIGDRKRALCAKTRARIQEGLQRFCRDGQPIPPEAYDIPTTLPNVLPFLVKYNSNGKAESIFQPLGTVSSRARYGLVFLPKTWSAGTIPTLEDCTFRMLSPDEVKLAMCMQEVQIASRKQAEIIKQCGLAVPPPLAMTLMIHLFPILLHRSSPLSEGEICPSDSHKFTLETEAFPIESASQQEQ